MELSTNLEQIQKDQTIKFLKKFFKDSKLLFADSSLAYSVDFKTARGKRIDENIYFGGGFLQEADMWSDKVIIEKNRFVIDLDIRKACLEKDNITIDDEELLSNIDTIKQQIDGHELFKQRSYINFSGNGMHIFYIGDFIQVDKERYSLGVHTIYDMFDDLFCSGSAWKCDKAVANIGRLIRMPNSMNLSRKTKFGLNPSLCEILYEQDINSTFVSQINEFGQQKKDELVQKKVLQEEKMKQYKTNIQDKNSGYDGNNGLYTKILTEVSVAEMFMNHTGLEMQPDGKNFKSLKDGKNIGIFYDEDDNKLVVESGNSYISDECSFYNPRTFAQAILGIKDTKHLFDYFCDTYGFKNPITTSIKKEYKPNSKEDNEITKCRDLDIDYVNPYTRGIDGVAQKIGTFDRGDLVTLVGFPSTGKTEFSYFVARANADIGIKCLYLSLELPPEKMYERVALNAYGISKDVRQKKSLHHETKGCIQSRYNDLRNQKNLTVLGYKSSPSVEDLEDTITKYHKLGYDLFFIDNLGKVSGTQNENERFAEITSRLQNLKNNLNTCIFLLHHLTKPGKTEPQFMPGGPKAVRGSQKIMDNSTMVLEVFRDLDPDIISIEEKKKVDLILYKDTMGGITGTVNLTFGRYGYGLCPKKEPLQKDYPRGNITADI